MVNPYTDMVQPDGNAGSQGDLTDKPAIISRRSGDHRDRIRRRLIGAADFNCSRATFAVSARRPG